MSEFLHHLVANREWRQHDIELQRALHESLSNEILSWVSDPWEAARNVAVTAQAVRTQEQTNG